MGIVVMLKSIFTAAAFDFLEKLSPLAVRLMHFKHVKIYFMSKKG